MASGLPTLQDHTLLKGCIKKDRQAQRALYNKYAGKMNALALRYMGDEMEAEDVLVKAFTKIFQSIEQFKGSGSLEGWIRRIVVNEALSELRKKKLPLVNLEKEETPADFSIHNTELETEELFKIIQELPSGYRTVFNLYAIEGYSHKEIGERLNIDAATSKSQFSRAKKQLREKIKEKYPEYDQHSSTIN